jgi:hypothetical protein
MYQLLTELKLSQAALIVSTKDKYIRCDKVEAVEFIKHIELLMKHHYVFKSQQQLRCIEENFKYVDEALKEHLQYYKKGGPGYKKITYLVETLAKVKEDFFHPSQSSVYAV